MTQEKIAIFGAVIAAILFILRRHPNSAVYSLAFRHRGPAPNEGELLSHYMMRWAGFAFKYGLIFIFLWASVSYLGIEISQDVLENPYFQGVIFMGIPLFIGMSVLGGLGCLVKSIYFRFFKPNFRYNLLAKDFIDK